MTGGICADREEAISCMRCRQDSNAAYDYAVEMGLIKGTSMVSGPEGAIIAQVPTGQEGPRMMMRDPPIIGYFKRDPSGL